MSGKSNRQLTRVKVRHHLKFLLSLYYLLSLESMIMKKNQMRKWLWLNGFAKQIMQPLRSLKAFASKSIIS